MANVAVLQQVFQKRGAAPRARPDYLGPARVVAATPAGVRVEIGGVEATATMALAFPYEPVEGDVLLVIGAEGGDCYVIGVLSGAGRTVLDVPGDVEIRARGGSLSLAGEQGVHIAGPEVAIEARTLRSTADALVQKVGTLYQRVAALLSVRAGESETVVDGAQVTRAKTAAFLTEGAMSLNGKQIHLG